MANRIESDEYERARRQLRALVAVPLQLLDDVYDAAESVITTSPFRATKPRGLRRRGPIVLSLLLLTKALKTARAIRATVLEGCGQDAGILVRSLFETAVAIHWLLQTNTVKRGRLYSAHQDQRRLVVIEEMLVTPGLRRTGKTLAPAARRNVADWLTNGLTERELESVRKHWGGSGGLDKVVRKLPGWPRAYTLVYRLTSAHAHGADVIDHGLFTGSASEPLPTFKLLPGDDGAERNLATAALMLHSILNRMNSRMGLGKDSSVDELGRRLKSEPFGGTARR